MLPRLEDIGRTILELQQAVTVRGNPSSQEELEAIIPIVATLRDAIVQHLIQASAAAKSFNNNNNSSTSTTRNNNNELSAQQHEYITAALGLLRAIRELFPDTLEFSSALFNVSKTWWRKFSTQLQPLETTDGECILELQPEHHQPAMMSWTSHSSNTNNIEKQRKQQQAEHQHEQEQRKRETESMMERRRMLEMLLAQQSSEEEDDDEEEEEAKEKEENDEEEKEKEEKKKEEEGKEEKEKSVDTKENNNNSEKEKENPQKKKKNKKSSPKKLFNSMLAAIQQDEINQQQQQQQEEEDDEDEDDGGNEILAEFSASSSLADQWWESVLISVCGIHHLSECLGPDLASSQEAILISACSTLCLYALGPPITSTGETIAASVQRRAVNLVMSLPLIDATSVIRAVSRLIARHLVLLARRAQNLSSSSSSSSNFNSKSNSNDEKNFHYIALLEHQGTLALHRWFSLLATITRTQEHHITRHDSARTSSSTAASPTQTFLLPLLGVRELLSNKDFLDSSIQGLFGNWIRKLFSCSSSYFSNQALGLSGGTTNVLCELDTWMSALVHTSLRTSRVLDFSSSSLQHQQQGGVGVSEHSERTICHSANYFLHSISSRLCSVGSTTIRSSCCSSEDFSSGNRLDIPPAVMQLLRLVLLHDGIPFPPPRPTEACGMYFGFCNNCVQVCMEIRRHVSVFAGGLVLSLIEPDLAPWCNMLWRDGPNALIGSATSYQADSPSRRQMMSRIHSSFSKEEDSEHENEHDQEKYEKIQQAEMPERLYSPVQRAAAIFRLALLDGFSPSGNSSAATTASCVPGRVPAVVWAQAAESLLDSLLEIQEFNNNNQNSNNTTTPNILLLTDPANWLAVASAATVAATASLLRFPCDTALQRFHRVLKCRSVRCRDQQEANVFGRLMTEVLTSNHNRPRTSELFDNVNPIIFSEWEKIFVRCCEESLKQPSVSILSRQQQQNKQQNQNIPHPTRESSLSEREGGRNVIVWLDCNLTSSFLFGLDASSSSWYENNNTNNNSRSNSKGDDDDNNANNRPMANQDESQNQNQSNNNDNNNNNNSNWIPIWVTLLPESSAVVCGRNKETSSIYTACCGIVCADTALSSPLRPNDLVFFTPACPEDTPRYPQPEVLFPRVVLRAWRLVPGATALVPNISIRRSDSSNKSFRLVFTSGEEGYNPLHLRAAPSTDLANSQWSLVQWWSLMRELGRQEESEASSGNSPTSRMRTTPSKKRNPHHTSINSSGNTATAVGAAVFQEFGPNFVHSASKGLMRTFWCSLRDITIPILSGHSPCLWTISSSSSSSSSLFSGISSNNSLFPPDVVLELESANTAVSIWSPPYLSLGNGFSVTKELDAWKSTAAGFDIDTKFLETGEL